MPRSTNDRSSSPSQSPRGSANISRRELLAGAGAGAAALLLEQGGLQAQATPGRTVVFAHTTVVTVDAVQDDVALAVAGRHDRGDRPHRHDPQDVSATPRSTTDGARRCFPGLINCHAHLAATLARGFNEDFGFPNSARLAVQPASLLQGEEATLMVTVGALEAIRTGTTTIVENSGDIGRSAAALAQTGLRCVFAESIRDSENVAGPMSPEGLAKSEAPRFSARLRDEGMQRINDLFTTLARREAGTHQRVPGRRARRDLVARAAAGRPRLRRETRSRLHDPPVAEPRRGRFHGAAPWRSSAGVSRQARLPRPAAVRGALPVRRRRRYRAARPLAARSCRIRRRWPRTAASSRRSPPCERRAARSRTAPTTTPTTCSR